MNAATKLLNRLDRKSTAGLGFESFAAGAVLVLIVASMGVAGAILLYKTIYLIVWAVVTIGTIGRYLGFLVAVVAFVAFCYYGVRTNPNVKEDHR